GEVEARIKAARQRLQGLEAEARDQAAAQARRAELRLALNCLEEFAAEVHSNLEQADWAKRREIIRALVKRVEIGHDEVRIVYRVAPVPFVEAPAGSRFQDRQTRCKPHTPPLSPRLAPRTGCSGRIDGRDRFLPVAVNARPPVPCKGVWTLPRAPTHEPGRRGRDQPDCGVGKELSMAICPRVAARLSCLLALALPVLTGAEPRAVEQALLKEARTVPGRPAFLFTELTDKGPVPLHASGARQRFAIGSGFKVYILGALIDQLHTR